MCTICRLYWHSRQYPQQLIKNLRAVFQCLRKAGFKLCIANCLFGVQEVEFLRRKIKTKRVTPQKHKIAKFFENVKFSRPKKALQRYIGFLKYYRNCKPRLAERLTPFFQLLKTTDAKANIPIIPDILKNFREKTKLQTDVASWHYVSHFPVNRWFSRPMQVFKQLVMHC